MLLEVLFRAVDRVENDVRISRDNQVLVQEAHDPMNSPQQKPDRAFGSPLVVPSSSAPDARGGARRKRPANFPLVDSACSASVKIQLIDALDASLGARMLVNDPPEERQRAIKHRELTTEIPPFR